MEHVDLDGVGCDGDDVARVLRFLDCRADKDPWKIRYGRALVSAPFDSRHRRCVGHDHGLSHGAAQLSENLWNAVDRGDGLNRELHRLWDKADEQLHCANSEGTGGSRLRMRCYFDANSARDHHAAAISGFCRWLDLGFSPCVEGLFHSINALK